MGRAGFFDNVPRNSVTRQQLPHLRDQFSTAFDWHFEVSGAGHAIQLVQVIWHDAQSNQASGECHQCCGIVVDPSKQDGLIECGEPRAHEFRKALGRQSSSRPGFSRDGRTIGSRE